jgi:hypothetical protein
MGHNVTFHYYFGWKVNGLIYLGQIERLVAVEIIKIWGLFGYCRLSLLKTSY